MFQNIYIFFEDHFFVTTILRDLQNSLSTLKVWLHYSMHREICIEVILTEEAT